MNMTATERELLDASREIGFMDGAAGWFQAIVADAIDRRGKPIGDYMVSELRALIGEHRDRANRILSSKNY